MRYIITVPDELEGIDADLAFSTACRLARREHDSYPAVIETEYEGSAKFDTLIRRTETGVSVKLVSAR